MTSRAPVWWGVALVALSFLVPSLVLFVASGGEVAAMIVLAVPMVGVFGLVLSFVVGLTGRARAWTRTASATAALMMTLVWLIAIVALRRWDAWLLLPLVFVITWVFAALAAMLGWNLGDLARSALGKPGHADLFAPALANTVPMRERTTERYDWLAEAEPYLADTVAEAVRGTGAAGEQVRAAVAGVELRRLWNRPMAVAVTDRQLVIVPVTMRGRADGAPTGVSPGDVASVRIRSQRADGSRRVVPPLDDVVVLTTSSGARWRFVMPFLDRPLTLDGRAADGDGDATADIERVRVWLLATAGQS